MSDLIRIIRAPEEISALVAGLREAVMAAEITPGAVLDVFEAWAGALGERETADIPGVQFLSIWLRRGTLERRPSHNIFCKRAQCAARRGRRRCIEWRIDTC